MLPACLAVGRPIVFSVAIMVLSFLPVFALGGIEGKMFHPLAYTKTFALVSVAVLAITLVPALCTIFIRGRLRSESENPLVRGVIEVYRPVLSYLMDRPAVLAGILGVTFLLGFAPLGSRPIFLGTLFLAMVATALCAASRWSTVVGPACLMLIALAIEPMITPLGREFMTPLDEGMVMDMPITVPRASVAESVDDLKARDMVLCRFPEVDMVVGKAGRAETPTDPAPMDMIETMVNFRPREFWPRRKLRAADAAIQCARGARRLDRTRRAVAPPVDAQARRVPGRAGDGRGPAAVRRGEPRICLPPQPGDAARIRAGSRRPRRILPTRRRRGWSRSGARTSRSSTASCSRAPRRSSRGWRSSSSSTGRRSSTRPLRPITRHRSGSARRRSRRRSRR